MEILNQEKPLYALLEIPSTIDRFIVLPKIDGNDYIMMIDDIIRYHLDTIFNIFNYQSISAYMIKITRDAALDIESDLGKSFIEKLSKSVKGRKDGEPVRFVYDKHIEKETLNYLLKRLGVENTDSIIPGGRYHNKKDYMSFPSLGREDLLYKKIKPLPIKGITLECSMFQKVAQRDFLQYTPYHTFALIFGVPGLKVHSKVCVIERLEEEGLKRYGFISTGNFNHKTANIYTDYTLFTANQKILKDLSKLFNFFDTNYIVNKYKHLIVSPHYSRLSLYALIKEQIINVKEGKEGYIRLKLNSISNYAIIDKEHPRVYVFGKGEESKVYISSSDWMSRNLDHRVEVSCPIYDKDVKNEILDTLDICWEDNVKARIINKERDNAYATSKTKRPIRSQFETYEYYIKKAIS